MLSALPTATARVGFTIGPIIADPLRDVVYVADQTADRIVAINTDTGTTVATVSLPVPAGGLTIPPGGDRLYVSEPILDAIQIFALPGLSSIGSLQTTVAATNLVATAGDKLFANVGTDQFCPVDEIDADTGQVLQQLGNNYSFYEPLLRASPDGNTLYERDTGLSGGGGGINVFDVSTGTPVPEPRIPTPEANSLDFAVSTTTNQAFTSDGGVYGLGVTNLATSAQSTLLFGGYGSSVALMPNSNSVFGAAGPDQSMEIAEFDQTTGTELNLYSVYSVRSASLVITPNSHLLYAEDNTDPSIGNVLGIIGASTLTVSSAPAAQGTVTGTVYNDANGNFAIDAGETGVGGAVVFDDENGDGQLDGNDPSTVSNSDGSYTLTGVPTGHASIGFITPTGYVTDGAQYGPSNNGPLPVLVTSGSINPINFGIYQPVIVSGVVFDDSNANGERDQTESGLSGVEVYDDLNNDGTVEYTEPFALSGYGGVYEIYVPPAASSEVRLQIDNQSGDEVESTGFTFAPTSGTTTTYNWALTQGNYVSGVIADATTAYSSGTYTPLGGITVFADLNGDGILDDGEPSSVSNSAGDYSLGDVPTGNPDIRVAVPSGYTPISSPAVPANTTPPHTMINFTLSTALPLGAIYGQAYVDGNGNGVHDPADLPAVGVTIYIDVNQDGHDDAGDPATVTDSAGNWDVINLPVGTYVVRQVIASNVYQTSPSSDAQQTFSINSTSASAAVQGVEFGSAENVGTIQGTVFADTNTDGIFESNEFGENYAVVYLDANNNGVLDPGEAIANTDYYGAFSFTGLAPGTYNVREVLPSYQYLTTPTGAENGFSVTLGGTTTSVSGLLYGNAPLPLVGGIYYADTNGNGVADPGEVGLAGAQLEVIDTTSGYSPQTTTTYLVTDANGHYQLPSLPSGSRVTIEPVAPAGDVLSGLNQYTATVPSTVTSTQIENFFASPDAVVRGMVYAVTGTGSLVPGMPYLNGVTVYADLNNNGLLDPGEPFAVSSGYGTFQLGLAVAGSYTFRDILPSGYRPTTSGTAAQTLLVNTGSVRQGLNFYATDAAVAPVVSSVQINGNLIALAGAQRSMIDSVEYTFSEPVALTASDAFSIAVHAGNTGTLPTLSWSALLPDANGFSFTWVVSFSGSGVVGRSIADGVYDLSLDAGVASNNLAESNAASSTTTFARLFGDINGDGLVNNYDYALFGRSFAASTGQSNFVAAFDYNGDGLVNNYDYAQFGRRFGKFFVF